MSAGRDRGRVVTPRHHDLPTAGKLMLGALGEDGLRGVVAEVSGCSLDQVHDDATIWELGLDSLKMMVLTARLRALGYPADFSDLSLSATYGEWIRILSSAQAAALAASPPLRGGSDAPGPVVDPAVVPMTPMQAAYWRGRDPALPLGGAGAQYYVEFDRAVDGSPAVFVERLNNALRILSRRHAMLRARVKPPTTMWVEDDPPEIMVGVFDERSSNADEVRAALDNRRRSWAQRTLDIEHGEVLDVGVSLLPHDQLRTHLLIDMLIADGESFATLLGELSTLLDDPTADLGPAPPSFGQAVTWCQTPPTAADEKFWAAALESLSLPPDACTPPGGSEHQSGTRRLRRHDWIAPNRRRRLERVAAETRTTLAAVLATAFAEVIARWCGTRKFALNVPTSLRSRAPEQCRGVIGDFTDFALVGIDLPTGTWGEECEAVHHSLVGVLQHGSVSGTEQLRALSRREGRPVTAPVVFTSVLGMGEFYHQAVRSALGEPVWTSSQVPQTILDCQILDDRDGIAINWDVTADVWPEGVVEEMFAAYLELLARVEEPHSVHRRLAVAVPAEQREARALHRRSDPGAPRLLHTDLLRQAEQRPDDPALICGATTLSYGELTARASRIADGLAQSVASDARVAICLPKGADQIVATLGVVMAGLTYVPMAPSQPTARREQMVRCGITVAIVPARSDDNSSEIGRSGWPDSVQLFTVVEILDQQSSLHPLDARREVAPSTVAYVIFTSGSTGLPKGVVMTHQAAVNTLDDIRRRFALGPGDRVLGVSQLDFDLSVYDIFATLGSGAALVLSGGGAALEPEELWQLADRQCVTVWNSVPALFDMVLTAARDRVWPSLRLVLLSGDWVATHLPVRISGSGVRLIAMGGATEAGIWSNFFDTTDAQLDGWLSAPYGYPLTNQAYRVIDPQGDDCPDWVAGELLIGGASLAEGYLDDPAQTAERFILADGIRWYRTGDFGRYRPGAVLEFLGRRDQQVKVGGFRIELGEVEAACRRCDGVAQAVVVAAGPRKQTLVAFVIWSDRERQLDQVEADLRRQLPAYMVPRQIVAVDRLPLTSNEKIDRAELVRLASRPSATVGGALDEANMATLRSRLHRAWRAVADGPLTGADNFFRAGGDSLIAVRLLAELEHHGVAGGTLRGLVESPTMDDFLENLSVFTDPTPRHASLPEPKIAGDDVTLTPVQRAYLMGEQPDQPLGGVRAMSYWEFDSNAPVDVSRLRDAVHRVAGRHPMLRGQLIGEGLRIAANAELPVESLSGPEFTLWRDRIRRSCGDDDRHPLQLAVSRDNNQVGIWLDHLFLDALSAMVVLNDLGDAYESALTDPPVDEPGLIDGTHVRPADRAYWNERIKDLPAAPLLPTSRSPSAVNRPTFGRCAGELSAGQWSALQRVAQRLDTSAGVLLLTAFARVVAAGSRDPEFTLIVTTFDRGRNQLAVSGPVGDFTDLLVLPWQRLEICSDTFADGLAHVWRGLADAVDHRSMTGLAVMSELAQRGHPLGPAIVFTSAIGLPRRRDPLQQPFGVFNHGLSQTPQTLLDCQVLEFDGRLVVNLDYVTELLPGDYVDDLLAALLAQLNQLIQDGHADAVAQIQQPTGTDHHAAVPTGVLPAAKLPVGRPDPETLEVVREVWSRMLGGPISLDDDFFDLGGDSLVATATVAAIRGRTGVDVTLREVFSARTALKLSTLVGHRQTIDDMVSGAL